MKLTNTFTYGLNESMIASGYPMRTQLPPMQHTEKDTLRAYKLSSAKPGSGHDCMLKGIIVQVDVQAPMYVWKQLQRYHWFDIVSSQSTMHRIMKMDLTEQCNQHVTRDIISLCEGYVQDYTDNPSQENFQRVVANIPSGLMLTARVTTNYLQLKTMYKQRRGHKLEEWQDFSRWVESLEHSEMITGKLRTKTEENDEN